jgi:hypothetical protein
MQITDPPPNPLPQGEGEWNTQRKLGSCSGQAGLGTYLFPPCLSGRDREGLRFNAAELMQ